MDNSFIPDSYYVVETLSHVSMSANYQFQSTEDNHEFFQWLDVSAGIDGFVKTEQGVFGVASRIRFQKENKPIYRDFTIRLSNHDVKSEFDKRLESINNGSIFPFFTLCAWYRDKEFICGARINTRELYEIITNPCYKHLVKKNLFSDRPFVAVSWDDLKLAEAKSLLVIN
jgi:hypothetical protein